MKNKVLGPYMLINLARFFNNHYEDNSRRYFYYCGLSRQGVELK